jgi:hypothetical protein
VLSGLVVTLTPDARQIPRRRDASTVALEVKVSPRTRACVCASCDIWRPPGCPDTREGFCLPLDGPVRGRVLSRARCDISRLVCESAEFTDPLPAFVASAVVGDDPRLSVVRRGDRVEPLMAAFHVIRATAKGNADSRASPATATKFTLASHSRTTRGSRASGRLPRVTRLNLRSPGGPASSGAVANAQQTEGDQDQAERR